MNNTIERFSTRGIELFESKNKEDGTLPKLSGYAVKFNTYSELWYGIKVIVDPNFFDGVLEDPEICTLASYTHDTDGLNVVARLEPKRGINKIQFSVDKVGLKYECEVVNTSLGRDLIEQVRFGNVQGVSMGVEIAEDDWTGLKDGYQVRRLVKCAKLDHIAFTSIPAFPDSTAGSEFSLDPTKKEFYLSMAKNRAPNPMPEDYYRNKITILGIDL